MACGKDHVPVSTPVDMEYNVSIETLEDACTESAIPADLKLTLNVALQTDGIMTINYPAGLVPGYGYYKGMVITDGFTEGKLLTEDGQPDLSVVGSLTMEALDLTFEGQRLVFQDDGTQALCGGNTKVRLTGTARPLWDVATLDGKYEAGYEFYGLTCVPGVPEENEPLKWVVPLDIRDRDGSAFLSFDSHDEALLFEMPTATLASGNVNWEGLVYILSRTPFGDLISEFEGSVTGNFAGESYYLRTKFFYIGDQGGCDYVLDITGAKHPPDTVNVNNIYRLAFLKSDECAADANGNPSVSNFVLQGDVALRKDGSYLSVMHGHQRFDLEPKPDGTYGGSWGNSTQTLDYTASVNPPNVSLSYTWGFQTQTGTCNESYTAVGVPRFFPEMALDTPKLKDAKRLAKQSEHRSLGLSAAIKNSGRKISLSEAPQFVQQAILNR